MDGVSRFVSYGHASAGRVVSAFLQFPNDPMGVSMGSVMIRQVGSRRIICMCSGARTTK
jgi:hypothetical protein